MNIAHKKATKTGLCAAIFAATLSITGCSYINAEATTLEYAPSDGIVETMGHVSLNNILIAAESKDSPGRLLGTVVNSSDQDLTVRITAGQATADIQVPANGETRLEDPTNEIILEPAGAEPGLMVETTFDTGQDKITKSVPVLNHTFERYAEYIPGGAPSTPANPSNTPGAGDHHHGGGH